MLRSIPAFSRAEWLRLSSFGGAVALLHIAGWGLFLFFARSNPALAGLGTLAYTFGSGKVVISTPYWHAAELLGEDRGVLVPFADSTAIASGVVGLLRDEERRDTMRRNAYRIGREMVSSEAATTPGSEFGALGQRASRRSDRRPVRCNGGRRRDGPEGHAGGLPGVGRGA